MIQNLKHYLDLVEQSTTISKDLLLANAQQQVAAEKETLLRDLNEDSAVKVPIVGDFDAGKSSMLNALLSRHGLLPVDITPETAVAYELYYAPNEKVELYRDGQKIDEQQVNAIKQLTVKPGDVAKVFINSQILKDLQDRGIVLVDMPGIDSGIEAHNAAIMHYIKRGTSFVLLADVEQGSLHNSTLAFMTELGKYNLKPAVFLSKADKKPESELPSILEYVRFQATRALGDDTYVGCISAANGNLADFTTYLDQLDSNAMVTEKFAKRIASFITMQIVSITAQKDTLNANIQDVEAKIAQLEAEKERIRQELEQSIPTADSPEKSTQDILDQVTAELNDKAKEIARMVVDKESANTINGVIMNYIRPVIINAFKEEGEQYANALNTQVDEVSRILQDALNIDGNLIDDIVDDLREEIVGVIQLVSEALMTLGGPIGKIIGTVLMYLGDKIPEVLRWFFGKSKEDVVDEATEKLRGSVIDQVCEKLRPTIQQQVVAQQQRIRENINNKVANSISNLQDALHLSSQQGSTSDMEARVAAMDTALAKLNELKAAI